MYGNQPRNFQKSGTELVKLELPESFWISNSINLITGAEGSTIYSLWLHERTKNHGTQTRQRLMAGLLYPATDYIEALSLRSLLLGDFFAEVFSQADVLHAPVLSSQVPTIKESNIQSNPDFLESINQMGHCTRPFYYLGLPALVIPAEKTSYGLPTGFQLIGRSFEATLFKLAHAYENEGPWSYPELIHTSPA